MTLNLMLITPWGIWQSSDHRLTDPRTGELVDDYSMKQISMHCPDGAALITYTGIGKVADTHISDWVRGVIRGRTRSLDETFIVIREQATKWISPIGKHLMFNIGAFLAGQPWVVQIGNQELRSDWRTLPPTAEFHTSARKIGDEPLAIVSGARDAVSHADLQLLARVVKRRPKKPQDFHALLAGINRRASEHPKYREWITSTCVTVHMPPAGEPIDNEMHGWEPDKAVAIPIVLFGIDLTDFSQVLTDQQKAFARGDAITDEDEFQRRLEIAAKRGVQPKSGRLT
jgi:hypothetical protein